MSFSDTGLGLLHSFPQPSPQSPGPSLNWSHSLVRPTVPSARLTSLSIAGALFRALQIWAPQHCLRLHPRAQDCPGLPGPWRRRERTPWEATPPSFTPPPPLPICPPPQPLFLEMSTSGSYLSIFVGTGSHRGLPPTDLIPASDLKITTKQGGEFKSVIKSSSVIITL